MSNKRVAVGVLTGLLTSIILTNIVCAEIDKGDTGRDVMRLLREKQTGKKTSPAPKPQLAPATVKKVSSEEPAPKPQPAPATVKKVSSEEPAPKPQPAPATVKRVSSEESAPARPVSDKMLSLLPADCLFCVRINNLDKTLTTLDEFLVGISPIPVTANIFVRSQIASVMGDPMLENINTRGSFAIFGQLNDGPVSSTPSIPDIFIAALIPIKNYNQFVGNNPNCKPPDSEGVSELSSVAQTGQKRNMLITGAGGYAIVTGDTNYDSLVKIKSAIGSSAKGNNLLAALKPDDAKKAKTEPLWAYGNIELAQKAFSPFVSAQLGQMDETMAQMPGQNANFNPAKIMEIYANFFKMFSEQSRYASLSMEPTMSMLNLNIGLTAKPGSELAKWFVRNPQLKAGFPLAAFLREPAAMNCLAKIDKAAWIKCNDSIMEMLTEAMAGGITAEQAKEWKSFANESMEAVGNEMAVSFSYVPQKPFFELTEIVRIEDPEKILKLIDRGLAMASDMYEAMGMDASITINPKKESYKGAAVYTFTLDMQMPEPAESDPQTEAMKAAFGDFIFEYKMAIIDNLLFLAAGADAEKDLYKLIDQSLSSVAAQPTDDIKTVLKTIPNAEDADAVISFNWLRMMSGMSGIMGAAGGPGGEMMAQTFANMDIKTKSCVSMAVTGDDGAINLQVVMPKEHLAEMMAVQQQMMQQMMMQQQQQMQQQQNQIQP